MKNKNFKYFITCPAGFEHQLAKELKDKGIDCAAEKHGGIEAEGLLKDGMKICLWSGIAGRVLLVVSEFSVNNENDIYENAVKLQWSSFFSSDKTIAIETTSVSGKFNNESYLSLRVKDGISDYFMSDEGKRPDVERNTPDIKIHLFVSDEISALSFDISGGSLHQRGYREAWTDAPIRENTAAALLHRAGWKEISAAGGSFIDPMCGSGTFLIEAAMIAENRAPGLSGRKFCFENLKIFIPSEWKMLLKEAEDLISREKLELISIAGFDIDRKAVSASIRNIALAGYSKYIKVKQADIADLEKNTASGFSPGLACINLPYGKRIGSRESLSTLYRVTGDVLKKSLERWKVLILAEDSQLSRETRLKPLQVNTVYNGPVKCTAVISIIDSSYRERNREGKESKENVSVFYSEMLANRLRKNMKMLKNWIAKENISCFRIYDADIPEYSAAVDLYENKYIHIQEYAPPPEIPPEKSERRLKEIIHTAGKVFQADRGNIFVKQRRRQKENSRYEKEGDEGELLQVNEGGLKFYVNFTDYLDTGLFLDHRYVRSMIQSMAKGKKFLNLFSYTAAASVYAASGGAALTVSVDTSSTYHSRAEKNFKLNSLDPEKNILVRSDCMNFLENDKAEYDMIFIDPPTFSNSKSRTTVFDVQADHMKMLEYAKKRLEKNGIIIFSNNYKKFKLDDNIYKYFQVEDITRQSIPPDFSRNSRIHHCWILKAASPA